MIHSGAASHPVFRDLAHRYGDAYNRGDDVGLHGGYPGTGHWDNRDRWQRSAAGILTVSRMLKNRPARGYPGLPGVLDIGCGRGWVARELRAKDCHVTGLDAQPAEEGCLSEFVRWDLDSERIPVRVADYDWLLLLDVIEHLKSPERFMERLRDEFEQKQPTILLTAPNTAFVVTRLGLLVGQLNYGREGILDFTHTRLFTSSTLRDLLEQVGYEILEVRGIPAPFPKALGYNWFSRLLVALNELLIRFSKTLFSYQLFFRLRPLPTVRTLLTATRTHTESKSRRLDG